MADDNKMSGDDKNMRKPGGGRMQPSTIAVWIAIIGGMALLFTMKDKWEKRPARRFPNTISRSEGLLQPDRQREGQLRAAISIDGDHRQLLRNRYNG
jgi:hypothetical protein